MAKTSTLSGLGARAEPVDPERDSLEIPSGQLYVSAAQLAHRFGVGVKWINQHKLHLGATPISNSTNSKLRYYLPTADAYMQSRTVKPLEKRRRRVRRSSEALIQFV